jgi:hypothetical protein
VLIQRRVFLNRTIPPPAELIPMAWVFSRSQVPVQGIRQDVIADAFKGAFVADDVFVVVALPQASLKRRPSRVFYHTDVFVGGHGFEPLHNRR